MQPQNKMFLFKTLYEDIVEKKILRKNYVKKVFKETGYCKRRHTREMKTSVQLA